MSNFKHELSNDVSEGWKAGDFGGWRPAMAYPLFVGFGLKKAKCGCGRVFKNVDDFYAHYLYQAIWKLESTVIPVQWTDLAKATETPSKRLHLKKNDDQSFCGWGVESGAEFVEIIENATCKTCIRLAKLNLVKTS